MRSRRARVLAGAALLIALLAGATPGQAYIEGKFCEDAQDIVGFGSSSQVRLQYDLFIPSYEAKCAKGGGLITYFTGDESTTFERMLYRGPDSDNMDHFWGRDSALSESELIQVMTDSGRSRGAFTQVGHFPLFIQGIAVGYNLNCTTKSLNLSAMNLSLMYLGAITTWNDPRILADNQHAPELASCAKVVKLTGRADAAGESATFKTYLSRRNPAWTPYAQNQLNTQWPAPLVCRGGGDAGAAGCVASNTGSIGYVSIARAQRMGLRVANIERISLSQSSPAQTKVDFVAPSLAGCTAAADSVQIPPAFSSYSDWNLIQTVDARQGYPICYFSYLMAYQKLLAGYSYLANHSQAQTLRDYLTTIFSDKIQAQIGALGYARIPKKFLDLNREGLDLMQGAPDCVMPVNVPREIDDYRGCFELIGFLQRKGILPPPSLTSTPSLPVPDRFPPDAG